MAQYLDNQGQQMPASDSEARIYRDERGRWWVRMGQRNHQVSVRPLAGGRWDVRVDGVSDRWQARNLRDILMERMGIEEGAGAQALELRAPMPGKVLEILVKEGQTVEEGEAMLVLEAMKMENVIKAVSSGKVSEVPASVGKAVEKGALLVGFEAD